MRALFLLIVALAVSSAAFAQGTVTFANRGGLGTTEFPGQVLAPIYREDPADPTHRISGNTPAGTPAGTTSYNSAAVIDASQGRTFVATLWGLDSTLVTGDAANNNLLLTGHGSTGFRSNASPTFAGIFIQPADPAEVPGIVSLGQRATFQVRVWDTMNGTIASWNDVWDPQNADVLRGYSELFTLPWHLGDPTVPSLSPFLQGLESFNVFIVPEPSVLILGILILCGLLCFRSRNSAGPSLHPQRDIRFVHLNWLE